jgi:23S rRNA (uracil1939-C5)-methyltransferase
MQADKKKKDVEALVEKAHLKVRVGDVHMAKNDTHYRNKVIVGFAKDKGKVYSGLYAPHSHRVVKTENCTRYIQTHCKSRAILYGKLRVPLFQGGV